MCQLDSINGACEVPLCPTTNVQNVFLQFQTIHEGKNHPWGVKVWVRPGIYGMMCDQEYVLQ